MRLKPIWAFAWFACCGFAWQSKGTVQIDVSGLLNARPVTTCAGGRLTGWTKGIDGNGEGDGYLTRSASVFNGDKDAHALPDDPVFPANAQHPVIELHYDNADSTHNQARYLAGAGEFTIPVPKAHYLAVYLALTSSEGASSLTFELFYTNGTVVSNYLLPDYYNNIAEKYPNLSTVATDLAKWNKKNIMAEKDHHNIHLLKLNTNPHNILAAIKVKKGAGGYLLFWGATGITE